MMERLLRRRPGQRCAVHDAECTVEAKGLRVTTGALVTVEEYAEESREELRRPWGRKL